MSILCSMVGATYAVAVAQVIRYKNGISAHGGAALSSTQSKFGGTSLGFGDGVGDFYKVYPATTSTFGGSGDMTFEFWYWRATSGSGLHITDFRQNGSDGSSWTIVDFEDGRLGMRENGYLIATNFGITTQTWTHVACVKQGTTVKWYKNGTLTDTTTGHAATFNNRADCLIGANYADSSAGNNLNGYIDELRISSTARYTANFTAPTAQFVNDANTLLLIHADGTNGTTFIEDDNGVRAPRSIVGAGGAQTSTTQSKFGGTSLSLDGTGDYLNVGETSDFAFGTGNFTIEAFIRNTKASSTRKSGIFSKRNFDNINSGGWGLYLTTDDGKIGWEQLFSGGTSYEISTTIAANTWYHVAVVRNGTAMNIYIDGTSRASWTDSTNYTNVNQLKIGTFWDSTQNNTATDSVAFQGFIDEMRVSDSARYTTTFTPTTTPFVNDANTLLLIHADGTNAGTVFRDDTGSVRSSVGIQAVGNAQISTAQSKFGGSSVLFDGTGDSLKLDDSAFAFGTGDFTYECFVRPTDTGNFALFDGTTPTGSTNAITVWIDGTVKLYSGGWIGSSSGQGSLSNGTWYHVAVSRTSGTLKVFVDGTSVLSTSNSTNFNQSILQIGDARGGSYDGNGYMDEIRVSNIGRYTDNFTPSTTPFQNDANTLLLMHCDGTNASTVFTDDNGKVPV